MKQPIVSVLLLVLLVGSVAFGVWQYSENTRLKNENERLRSELDSTSEQLRNLEQTLQEKEKQMLQEKQTLQNQLTQQETRIRQLEQQVQNLTSQIQKLREQLRLRDYTTIGLTFLWPKVIQVKTDDLSQAVQDMNRIWDPLHIYFFIYHAGEADLPKNQACSGVPSWATQAWTMYPGNDIPIAIFSGFTLLGTKGIGCAWPDAHVIAVVESYVYAETVLTHEVAHIFGVSDEAMGPLAHQPIDVIPSSWYGRLETAAEWFQMSLPSS